MAALNRFRLALLIQLLILGMGTAGYVLIERWSVFDALYMSVITLATIGYGEVRELSQAGRTFTMGLIVAGVTSGVYTAATLAELLVGNLLREVLGRRRMEHDLEHLSDHTLICGWGRMGQEIGGQFRARGVAFVVIEISEEACRRMGEQGVLYVRGNASDDAVLRAAGVERARALIAVASTDADNIFITLSARSLSKGLFIVSRSIHERDVHKLEIAGADRVLSPYVIGARRIAAAVFHPTVVDFLDLEIRRNEVEWELDELPVTREASFAEKPLRSCGIRERTGCTVLAIKEGTSGRFHTNPHPDTALRVGDVLVVLGTPVQLEEMEKLAGIPAEKRHPRARPQSRRE
jgi:voltage-gated potassium channel